MEEGSLSYLSSVVYFASFLVMDGLRWMNNRYRLANMGLLNILRLLNMLGWLNILRRILCRLG